MIQVKQFYDLIFENTGLKRNNLYTSNNFVLQLKTNLKCLKIIYLIEQGYCQCEFQAKK